MTLIEIVPSDINSSKPIATGVSLTSSLIEATQLLDDYLDCVNCEAACFLIPKRRPTGNEVVWAKFSSAMLARGEVGITCEAKSAPSTADMTKNCHGKPKFTVFID